MKGNCLDIGSIQAFLDMELSNDETARVSGHIAVCDSCSMMLAVAEEESAIVFPALEREFNTLVPSQRLWNKINDSIALDRESRPLWQKLWAFLSISLVNPSLAAAATLIIVVGLFAAFWMETSSVPIDVAVTNVTEPSINSKDDLSTATVITPAFPVSAAETTDDPEEIRPETVSYRTDSRQNRSERQAVEKSVPASSRAAIYLPGEENYVKTIASLNSTVEDQKDGILRPSERIAYERDMAVVNDTISKMKVEVAKNPKNESAKQVLYSSYQNKIDLLNSVAQKEELVASLQR